jgi:hypothetical protein
MSPGVGRPLIRLRLRCEYIPSWIVGEYYDYLNTDTSSSGLRLRSLDAEGPPGPLDGLQLAR